ncbi:unnamed protein product [Diabrotica balteata]|uniref:Uncharacterized protein n=1 Tax=Diabrotica balteata TaxID=107213 RepID=A0A9N9T1C7_DIABA|nr:unnamed protein product [Diabrotica balteata]
MHTASPATLRGTQSYNKSESFSIPSTTPTSATTAATPIEIDTDNQSCTGAEDNTETLNFTEMLLTL